MCGFTKVEAMPTIAVCSARMRTVSARPSKPPLSPLLSPGPRREGGQPSPRGKCPYEGRAGCTSGRHDRAWSAGRCTQVDTRSAGRLGCGGVRAKAWQESTPRASRVSSSNLPSFWCPDHPERAHVPRPHGNTRATRQARTHESTANVPQPATAPVSHSRVSLREA
jgi:hypothetical protein